MTKLKDHNYYGYHAPINHAVLTHCFDPSGTRLFVGGGPLMVISNVKFSSLLIQNSMD